MPKIAILAGTGFYPSGEVKEVGTDYGNANVATAEFGGKEVCFIARHGDLEAPHLVNYRANLQAAKLLGASIIYAVTACGRLSEEALPGRLGTPDGSCRGPLEGRVLTFAEKGLLLHASMREPFSNGLREILNVAWVKVKTGVYEIYRDAPELKPGFLTQGVYYTINGPNFATSDEEKVIRSTIPDATFIGMTVVPEIVLARELGMAYAAVAMVTDHSSYPRAQTVTHAGVMETVKLTSQAAKLVIEEAIRNTPDTFYDPVAHTSLANSLQPDQVNLDLLRKNGRDRLAAIIEKELLKRSS